jgi:hypothetical protein
MGALEGFMATTPDRKYVTHPSEPSVNSSLILESGWLREVSDDEVTVRYYKTQADFFFYNELTGSIYLVDQNASVFNIERLDRQFTSLGSFTYEIPEFTLRDVFPSGFASLDSDYGLVTYYQGALLFNLSNGSVRILSSSSGDSDSLDGSSGFISIKFKEPLKNPLNWHQVQA